MYLWPAPRTGTSWDRSVAERVRPIVRVTERDVPSTIMTYRMGKTLRGPTAEVSDDAAGSGANAA